MAVRREVASPASEAGAAPQRGRTSAIEIGGYLLVAAALFVLLLLRVRNVDGFYLDEWLYTHGAEYMWSQLPLGPVDQIPGWTRGPQRLYTWLLMLWWGPLGTPAAYTASHVMNVFLLVSGVWPAALIARRVIESPWLRVLAVALATALPWLVISANLLTENAAFPVFLWTYLAIVVAAERPRPATQIAALVGILLLSLCRLNLAVMFVVLVVVVAATELARRFGSSAPRESLRAVLRRQSVVVAALGLAVVAAVGLYATGGASLGAYGAFTDTSIFDSIWGSKAEATGRAILTYTDALATGSFLFPLLLGLAVALAGTRGRLGRRVFVPALTALASLVGVIVVIAIWTGAASIEERYAFYVISPLAILAVAGLARLRQIVPELIVSGVLITFAIAMGTESPGTNSGYYFAAPARAFWSRVVDHRLRTAENDLLGWLPGAGHGWLLAALVMIVAVGVVVALAGRRPRVAALLTAAGLAVCLLAQAAVLNYDYGKLLYGTPEAPGGLAMSADHALDRDDWIDDALPDDAEAAIVPAVSSYAIPYGDAERQEFWNKGVTAVVALRFDEAIAPLPPGMHLVQSYIDEDGLAGWKGPRPGWFAAQPDDPRVQFAGRRVATSRSAPFTLSRATGSRRAIWTAAGIEPDGSLLEDKPATLTLDRARVPGVRAVTLLLHGFDVAPGPVSWTVRALHGGRTLSGRLAPAAVRKVRLAVPPCDGACPPMQWRLTALGKATAVTPPFFGAPPPAKSAMLQVSGAHLGRG
jgi:hypothetical protein